MFRARSRPHKCGTPNQSHDDQKKQHFELSLGRVTPVRAVIQFVGHGMGVPRQSEAATAAVL